MKLKFKTPAYKYNCFGYSVGIKKWITFDLHTIDEVCFTDVEQTFKNNTSMLDLLPNLTRVQRQDMRFGKKYIAFRIGEEDFHFCKRNRYGHWTHKRGPLEVEKITEQEVFADTWYNGTLTYDSEIAIYEVRGVIKLQMVRDLWKFRN